MNMVDMQGSHGELNGENSTETWQAYSEGVDVIREREYPLLKGPNTHKYPPSPSSSRLNLEIQDFLGNDSSNPY
jgi:hypothetical protein